MIGVVHRCLHMNTQTARVWSLLVLVVAALLAFKMAIVASAAGADAATEQYKTLGKAIGAALAMGLSGIGAGYALARAGSAASAATAERPEVSGKLLIYLVLGEGIAIYGLVVAVLIIVLIA